MIFAGFTSLSVGVIGIFVPLLPTTPFVLLSATCFLKSSKSLYNWITNHKLFGDYIKYYLKFRAVSLRSKIISNIFLWVVILISAIFYTKLLWIRILLITVATCVTIHLVKMKTLTKEMIEKH
ncbi:MAG: YbaN family protein [Candidatus Delongbacteria bacterium]|nr:YbaN family protein [Candidatus Delongbacteria bacterium]